jgi:hypothetical protein
MLRGSRGITTSDSGLNDPNPNIKVKFNVNERFDL